MSTFDSNSTELADKYRKHYLVNIDTINFNKMKHLCDGLNIKYERTKPQETMNNVVKSLSDKYKDRLVILLCDEMDSWFLSDWSNMKKTCHNVIWLIAINPRGIPHNMILPTSDDVIKKQLFVKYRNCYQIR